MALPEPRADSGDMRDAKFRSNEIFCQPCSSGGKEMIDMKVTMEIGKHKSEIVIQDFHEEYFVRMIYIAARTVADQCMKCGIDKKEVEEMMLEEVRTALEDIEKNKKK